MDCLTNLASFVLLSASAALTTGCMAEAADEDQADGAAQAAQVNSASDADQETTADSEEVGESAHALTTWFGGGGVCYRPEVITRLVPRVNWTAIPQVSYRYVPSVHYLTQCNLVYRPYFVPVTCFVSPC